MFGSNIVNIGCRCLRLRSKRNFSTNTTGTLGTMAAKTLINVRFQITTLEIAVPTVSVAPIQFCWLAAGKLHFSRQRMRAGALDQHSCCEKCHLDAGHCRHCVTFANAIKGLPSHWHLPLNSLDFQIGLQSWVSALNWIHLRWNFYFSTIHKTSQRMQSTKPCVYIHIHK